jgi:PAS domain S-box-containing protein
MRRSIRTNLLAMLIAVGSGPLLLSTAYYGAAEYRDTVQITTELQAQRAGSVAARVEAFIQRIDDDLRTIDRYRDFENLSDSERQRVLSERLAYSSRARARYFEELAFVSSGGRIGPYVARERLQPPEGFLEGMALRPVDVAYGVIEFAADTGEPRVRATRALHSRRSGELYGWIVADVRLAPVGNVLSQVNLAAGEDIYVLDAQGRVIAHRSPSVVLRGTQVEPPSGAGVGTGLSGQDAIQAVRPVPILESTLLVVCERTLEASLRSLFERLVIIGLVLIASIALIVVLAREGAWRIVNPIERISEAARSIRTGSLDTRVEPSGDHEIRMLGETFNTMTDTIRTQMNERARAEAAARASAERFRDFAEVAADWFWEMGPDLRFTYLSDRYTTITGTAVEDVLGKTRMEVSSESLADAKWHAHQAVLEAHEPFRDFRFQGVGGDNQVHYFSVSGKPVFDRDGEFQGYRGCSTDLTAEHELVQELIDARHEAEKRTAELREAQEQSLREARLSALGRVTAGVAHDLRNPLGALRNYLAVMRRVSDKDMDRLENAIERAERTVHRCDEIIEGLLRAVRFQELQLEPTDIDEWVEEVVDDYRVFANTVIETDLASGARLSIDRAQMSRVLTNLLDNAAQAMQSVTTANRSSHEPAVAVRTRNEQGWLDVTVADRGTGIPESELGKVFEPLYSTKLSGVGLGLHVVRQIVEQHGGQIRIANAADGGVQATVRFSARAG